MNSKSVPIRFSIVFNLFGINQTSFGAKSAKNKKNDCTLVAYFSLKFDYFSEGNESREKLPVVL